jgi:membrane-associated protease RseP (regulator of RpoE activity)
VKFLTSLCLAISLGLGLNQATRAQPEDPAPPQREAGQNNFQQQEQASQLDKPQQEKGNSTPSYRELRNRKSQQQSQQGKAFFPSDAQAARGLYQVYPYQYRGQDTFQNRQNQLGQIWDRVLIDGGGQPWLGGLNQGPEISLIPADDALREHLKIPKGQGLVVTALLANSPAAHAGIRQNDVILKLGDTPLAKPDDLAESLKKVGEKPVSLSLVRNGTALVLQVQPVIRVTLGPARPKAADHEYWIGVSVSAIEPALRSQLQIPASTGVMVDSVVKDSPAEKAGVKDHDILLELDGKPLPGDPHKLAEAVQAHGQKPISLTLIRAGGNKNQNVTVTPEQRKPTAVSERDNLAKAYYFVRPGAVLTDPNFSQEIYGDWYRNLANRPNGPNQPVPYDPRFQRPAPDASAAMSKRLDALDAEIKQLRKAVEALGNAERTIEELQKAAAALNKAIKENK